MLKIYGSMQCPDCVNCCKDLERANVEFEFLDFGDSLKNLKEFLKLRDKGSVFDDAKREGYIGIPCIVDEQGSVKLDWSEYVGQSSL